MPDTLSEFYRFDLTSSNLHFEDEEAIVARLSQYRVIGMGEATHGTSEFYRFKHGLLKLLVDRLHFTHLAIEAGFFPWLAVADFATGGSRCTAEEAVHQSGFWILRTQEIVEMAEWLRDRKLKTVGVDCQVLRPGFDLLADLLPDNSMVAKMRVDYDLLERQIYADAGVISDQTRTGLLTILQSARTIQETAAGGTTESLRILCQGLTMLACADNPSAMRNEYMADNIDNIFAQCPDAKVAFWAHNAHINADADPECRDTGYCLRQRYGDEYFALALTTFAGEMNARTEFGPNAEATCIQLPACTSEHVESSIRKDYGPQVLIDLQAVHPRSLLSKRMRSYGAVWDQQGEPFEELRDGCYDAIAQFETSTCTNLLPGATAQSRRQKTTLEEPA